MRWLPYDCTLSGISIAGISILATKTVELKEASKIEIVSLMDNTVDFLSSKNRKDVQSLWHWTKEKYGPEWASAHTELPFAEHGFSMLLRIFTDQESWSILFDTGVSSQGVTINAKRMSIDLSEVSYVALSHGHYDHFGGLQAIVKAVNRIDLPIITHEDMVKRRGTASPSGEIREYPLFPSLKLLAPAKIVNTKNPHLIANDLACITGEIPRKVAFEKGLMHNKIYSDNSWQPDPFVLDDRALVVNIKGKGLVIISGCAHAGIINTIRYAREITGLTKVYAILGGFHLAGKEFEKRIEPTIEELKDINPELIVPSHCTGWRALISIAQTFPNAFASNSVGNIYQFE
jgi:7,8-dihydropterin-6-yl-methyl-4-(beta-D-ribofuranosyl)aminobenzene 5'-phosphate synthase